MDMNRRNALKLLGAAGATLALPAIGSASALQPQVEGRRALVYSHYDANRRFSFYGIYSGEPGENFSSLIARATSREDRLPITVHCVPSIVMRMCDREFAGTDVLDVEHLATSDSDLCSRISVRWRNNQWGLHDDIYSRSRLSSTDRAFMGFRRACLPTKEVFLYDGWTGNIFGYSDLLACYWSFSHSLRGPYSVFDLNGPEKVRQDERTVDDNSDCCLARYVPFDRPQDVLV